MHNCQIIDQLQIPQVLLHPFKPAFFMRHVLMSAFFNALYVNTLHGVCLIKKCVSLCKKHKTLRKPVPVFLHSMWFPLVCGFIADAVCLSYQVQKWNSASRFNVKGNFPYHFAIKLVHGLVTSRFQHPYEIETDKDNIRETAWNKAKSVGTHKNPCQNIEHIHEMVITEICRP